jgi:pimeloyl-ACP methyl ester carboxylesterase
MVAVGVAAELPDKVRAAVLEDPPFDTLGTSISKTSFFALFNGLRHVKSIAGNDIPSMASAMAGIVYPAPDLTSEIRLGDVRDAAQLRFGAMCLRDLDLDVFEPLLVGRWLDGWDWHGSLSRMRCPAMLTAADWSAGGMMPGDLVDSVELLIQDCTRVDFSRTGHQIHWQQPEAVVRAGMAFLESL